MFPVAGAAAGSLPAYLKGTHTCTQVKGQASVVRRRRCCWWSTLPHRLGSLDGGPDAGLDVVVVALVLVLLLAPDQVSVGEAIRLGLHLVKREGRQLEMERGGSLIKIPSGSSSGTTLA